MHAFVLASGFVISILAIDNVRLRMYKRRVKRERAAAVEAALGGLVDVDGVALPSPNDERWTTSSIKLSGSSSVSVPIVKLGGVCLSESTIWVGADKTVVPPPMSSTPNTKNYCASVWKAYRTRVARNAINATK